MEKQQALNCRFELPPPLQKRRPFWRAHPFASGVIISLIVGLFILYRTIGFGPLPPDTFHNCLEEATPEGFAWSYLSSQPSLNYVDCYQDFQCARLEVPLDWRNESNPKRVNLAVVRSPARVPVDDPRYAGAIIVNPGGPGGSGTTFVLGIADKLRDLLDTDEKAYDILSFDPRGTGYTDPPIVCFDEPLYEQSFGQQITDVGIPGSSNMALAQQYALFQGLGGACAPDSPDSIKHHLTTPYAVRDMLALVEAHGAWREAQKHGEVPSDFEPGKELLQYWGFSYGTLLGGTFASMYPDRIGRAVLDGVVDSDNYYSAKWIGNLLDTEAVFDYFFDSCASVGVPTCPLARHGKTGKDLREVFYKSLEDMEYRPIPVTNHHAGSMLTASEVKFTIFHSLYAPISFQALSYFVDMIVRNHNGTIPGQVLPPSNGQATAIGHEKTMHIACSDGDSQANATLEVLEQRLQTLIKESAIGGETWSGISLGCSGITVRSPWTFDKSTYGANETSSPILFVGNTADPVTPLANARKMSARFGGSRVLHQDGVGHCSISQYSRCTTALIREYFATGSMPPDGKKCAVDWHPFEPASKVERLISRTHSEERDVRAARAHVELQKRFWVESGHAAGRHGLPHDFYGDVA